MWRYFCVRAEIHIFRSEIRLKNDTVLAVFLRSLRPIYTYHPIKSTAPRYFVWHVHAMSSVAGPANINEITFRQNFKLILLMCCADSKRNKLHGTSAPGSLSPAISYSTNITPGASIIIFHLYLHPRKVIGSRDFPKEPMKNENGITDKSRLNVPKIND